METKPFWLTSEFAVALLALGALAIVTAFTDLIDAPTFWRLATVLLVAYLLSRGFAKARTPHRD